MKKWLLALSIMMILSISVSNHSQAYNYGIKLSDYEQDTTFNKLLLLESDIIKEIIVLPDSQFNQEEAANMINRLSLLPDNLLNKLVAKGIQVRLFNGKLTENPSASHLKGKIPRGYQSKITWDNVPGIGGGKIVLAKIGSSNKGQGHGSVNLELHELAHSIDQLLLKDVRKDPVFMQLWQEESNNMFPGHPYFLTYPEEYFAETFAYYYLNQDLNLFLSVHAPKTYEYISSIN